MQNMNIYGPFKDPKKKTIKGPYESYKTSSKSKNRINQKRFIIESDNDLFNILDDIEKDGKSKIKKEKIEKRKKTHREYKRKSYF